MISTILNNYTILLIYSIAAGSFGYAICNFLLHDTKKSRMLFGALLGTAFALLSGSEVIVSNFWFFSGIGGCAGYYCHFSKLHKPGSRIKSIMTFGELKSNIVSVALFGGSQMSTILGLLAFALSSLSGDYYSVLYYIAFIVALPILDVFISLNIDISQITEQEQPLKHAIAKIYMNDSVSHQLGLAVCLLLFSILRSDWLTLSALLFGYIFGGISIILCEIIKLGCIIPTKNGHILFGWLNRNNFIDHARIRDCIFGALAGVGLFAFVRIFDTMIQSRVSMIELYGFQSYLDGTASTILSSVWILLIILETIPFIAGFKEGEVGSHEIDDPDISLSHGILKNNEKESIPYFEKIKAVWTKISEPMEFPLYAIIPFLFIVLGSDMTASLMSYFVIFIVLDQTLSYKFFIMLKLSRIWQFILYVLPFVVLVLNITGVYTPTMFLTLLLYTFLFASIAIVRTLAEFIISDNDSRLHVSLQTKDIILLSYFILMALLIMTIEAILH